jgi:hypothetical protein
MAAYWDSIVVGYREEGWLQIYVQGRDCQFLRRCEQRKKLQIPMTVLPHAKKEKLLYRARDAVIAESF